MMRTHVEFWSEAFRLYPDDEEGINPGCGGRSLAEFLQRELPKFGINVESIDNEDWGWAVYTRDPPVNPWIGCHGPLPAENHRCVCAIDPTTPDVRRGFFNKVSAVESVERLAGALEAVLRSHPGIRNIVWAHDPA
ncbi:MAG: hypothetical protein JST54_28510 [Deltaproteobacteria bacterium]|nr:hypothetical protein [Deltaproteobacteria bacterium]